MRARHAPTLRKHYPGIWQVAVTDALYKLPLLSTEDCASPINLPRNRYTYKVAACAWAKFTAKPVVATADVDLTVVYR